jgi:hypothetical protein|eukprot:7391936-Prymnesium_polylepis.2
MRFACIDDASDSSGLCRFQKSQLAQRSYGQGPHRGGSSNTWPQIRHGKTRPPANAIDPRARRWLDRLLQPHRMLAAAWRPAHAVGRLSMHALRLRARSLHRRSLRAYVWRCTPFHSSWLLTCATLLGVVRSCAEKYHGFFVERVGTPAGRAARTRRDCISDVARGSYRTSML